jgi:DNA-binding HxlR family transcriptional regulator
MTEQQLYNWLMRHPNSLTAEITQATGLQVKTVSERLRLMEKAGYVSKDVLDNGLVIKFRWSVTEKATPWEAQEPAAHYGDGLPRVSSVFEYARSMA